MLKSFPAIDCQQGKFQFRIAGVLLAVSCGQAIRLRIGNPLYSSFSVRRIRKIENLKIDIRLNFRQLPPIDKREKTFDTGESWSMFRDGGYNWIAYRSPRYADPLWVARFDRSANRVDYYSHPPHPVSGKKTIEPIRPLCYPLDQLLLMYFLATRKGILTHAAGMVHKGKAYLFAGASGAGKSTFSLLLAVARAGKMLSDERMIVREIDQKMIAFGTPWAGTAGIAHDGSGPLAGIFFLKHGKSNRIEKVTAADALGRLLPMASVPWYDPDTATLIIAFAKQLLAKVPAYEMAFKPDRSAVDFLSQFQKTQS